MSEPINIVITAPVATCDEIRALLADPDSGMAQTMPHRVHGPYRDPAGQEVWDFVTDTETAEALLTLYPEVSVCGAWHQDGRQVGTVLNQDDEMIGVPTWPVDGSRWLAISGGYDGMGRMKQVHRPAGWSRRRF